MNEFETTGRACSHVVQLDVPRCTLHYEAVASFLAMRDAAAGAGIDLTVRSSFRDFATQLIIWNRKWRGEKPLYSREGVLLDSSNLADDDKVDAILAWSAVPGGSRHHWGSDIDVIDAASVPAGHDVQLTPEEYSPSGIFARLSAWLDANMANFGFFRPYRTDKGGVCIEPWHLSYAPVSAPTLERLGLTVLRRALEAAELEGKAQVLERLPEIYTRYVLNVDAP
jgi:LAS superfamily LD-carboxypeptidase LdcB